LSLGSPMSIPPHSPSETPFEQEVTLWPLLERATSLQTLLSAAVCRDIAVVAAAGNAGGETDLPAAYPWVISVMASTVDGNVACYSNEGQVAAPGGGLPDPNKCLSRMETLYDACAKAESAVQQFSECQELLMSWVTDSEGSSPIGYRFGYGAGTSFSTPLVSGLAALIQEASRLHEGRGWVSPDLIATRILSTTHHSGVIDVSRAVQETLNPR
jgi:subtilisin family serine protease